MPSSLDVTTEFDYFTFLMMFYGVFPPHRQDWDTSQYYLLHFISFSGLDFDGQFSKEE